jgi:prepilin-type N-terminal cleavage/methylation domain-containing protein
MLRRIKEKKAFTLIELLVVIAIIGLLTSIILVNVGPSRKKARDAQRQSDVHQVSLAMELCYNEAGCGEGKDKYISTMGDPSGTTIGSYLTVPTDPIDDANYFYRWTTNSGNPAYQYYCFYVKLETKADTWFCASNKGVGEWTEAGGYEPDNDDCCRMDVN